MAKNTYRSMVGEMTSEIMTATVRSMISEAPKPLEKLQERDLLPEVCTYRIKTLKRQFEKHINFLEMKELITLIIKK